MSEDFQNISSSANELTTESKTVEELVGNVTPLNQSSSALKPTEDFQNISSSSNELTTESKTVAELVGNLAPLNQSTSEIEPIEDFQNISSSSNESTRESKTVQELMGNVTPLNQSTSGIEPVEDFQNISPSSNELTTESKTVEEFHNATSNSVGVTSEPSKVEQIQSNDHYHPPNRTFAPLNIPLSRRRQTLTILMWFLSPWLCLIFTFLLLRSESWLIVSSCVLFLTWMMLFQRFPREGGIKQQWIRRLAWWKWFAEYFPIYLHATCDLPPDRNYIFGYHPHGIISLGAFSNFATEGTGFEEKFPGIDLRLLTLNANFRIPFYGLYLGLMGLCDASKESCNYILSQGKGHSIMLVLGGAKESLDAHPTHEYLLTLKNRKGFIKIGLAHGASLVPVFSFGENDLYDQISNPRGSLLRKIQIKIQKRLGYATPFFKGRGVFQYAAGFLPNRHPIHTYVGAPIHLPKIDRDKMTPEIVDKYHSEYMEALRNLFDTYKSKHGNAKSTITFVNDNE